MPTGRALAAAREPLNDEQRSDWLALALVSGLGPELLRRLLAAVGDARAVLECPPRQLQAVPGIGYKLAEAIAAARDQDVFRREWQVCREQGLAVMALPELPPLLREIPDPPTVLFCRGQLLAADELAVAIVGARHATTYGRRQAERLGRGLAAAGLTVVSGLARGIDAAAHRAALAAGGRTVAVMANGVTDIYPPEHLELAREIADQGAVVSECPSVARPLKGMFPRRNRLITGLSLGVVVVEAALRSGALISARHAADQGREVFAVPGSVQSRMSRGCHRLLREGATLVETVDDVIEELGVLVRETIDRQGYAVRTAAELQLNPQEREVLEALPDEPIVVDQLMQSLDLPVPRVLATLSALESRGMIRRISGQWIARRSWD